MITKEELNLGNKSKIYLNEPLSKHTTFKIGGLAKYFIIPSDIEDLKKTIKFAENNFLPYITIGAGSNILAKDSSYEGVVISLHSDSFKNIFISDNLVRAGAGLKLVSLIEIAIKNNLTGLEFLAGIPGDVGGSIFMNAGSKEAWIGNFIEKITALDKNGNLIEIKKDKLKFDYRHSNLDGYVIIEACFLLQKGSYKKSRILVENFIKEKVKNQELSLPSAGCIFKNPPNESAGKLIEFFGLKGKNVNDAVISLKHANFIVNRGNAKADDVIKLIDMVRNEIKEERGIFLELEIKII